ncbi:MULTISPECIES: helix-turn-helix domain-containing protein [Streptomyces]|uniref:helix-turn-helix domain-containing protein n=1 Tax=Streptomyces TaxID=1883 RepID=UPI003428027C
MSNDSLSSVKRALEVLRALGQGPMRVQAMAHAIGREKTQVSRTLKVLAEEGFAVRDPETMEYRLGWQFFALAAAAEENPLRQRRRACCAPSYSSWASRRTSRRWPGTRR